MPPLTREQIELRRSAYAARYAAPGTPMTHTQVQQQRAVEVADHAALEQLREMRRCNPAMLVPVDPETLRELWRRATTMAVVPPYATTPARRRVDVAAARRMRSEQARIARRAARRARHAHRGSRP